MPVLRPVRGGQPGRAGEAGRRRQGPAAVPRAQLPRRQHQHDYSSRAANALAVVLDASGPEVAKKFHDLLFENQPAEGSAGLSDAQAGLDSRSRPARPRRPVQPGIEDRTFGQWVENVNDQASKDGVNSTPTVKIDGKVVKFSTTDELVAEVEKAVAAG